jgi:hypothetical protein
MGWAHSPRLQAATPHPHTMISSDEVLRKLTLGNQRFVPEVSQPILASLVRENKLRIIGAYYGLQSGKVEVIA